VGIDNFSLDVISGLPDQTLAIWANTLEMAVEFNPPHISSYDLVIEEVTPFGRQYQPGELPLPSDDDTAAMYKLASSYLQAAGYEHYEISNYGRSGYQCRHNRVYWENRPYYAIGMGAASYTNGQRFVRPRRRQDYFKWVETYQGNLEEPPLTDHDRILESLMLGLRLREGVTLTQYPEPIQDRITQTVQPFIKENWVEINRDRLKLTDPDGFLFSNVVLSELFKELEP
jgi:oxygen-independent coproporphyrinogen-3 oxidase